MHSVKGPPDTPLTLFLNVIVVPVADTKVGALGVPGTPPVVIEVPTLVALPYIFISLAVIM